MRRREFMARQRARNSQRFSIDKHSALANGSVAALAHSYEFTDRLIRFTGGTKNHRSPGTPLARSPSPATATGGPQQRSVRNFASTCRL